MPTSTPLHSSALVIDAHCDILIALSEGKMALGDRVEVPDPATWEPPPGLERHPLVAFGAAPHSVYFGCMGQYDLPRLREGGITAQCFAIYLDEVRGRDGLRHGLEMAWALHHAIETYDDLEWVLTAADIPRLKREGKIGAILTMEGCEALGGDPRMLDLYYALGLRVASLTHTRRNRYADGCYAAPRQGGLTAAGRALVERMNRLGIVVDLVHIGEHGYWEILEVSSAPLLLSHTTPTMFPNSDPSVRGPFSGKIPRPRIELPRDRDRLVALAAGGGVLAVTWVCHATLEDVVRDIESALEVMGPEHVAIGSDLYGAETAPRGLEDISKMPAITDALAARGHSDDTILAILGGNLLRLFETVWV